MKKNRIWIIITLVLLALAIILVATDSFTTLRKDVSDFSVTDTASITKLFIADKNNHEVTLVRTPEGWFVNGNKKAQTAKVNSFLKTLADLEVRSPVPLAARNNVITRMATLAKKLEVYQVVPRIRLFNMIRLFPHEKNTKTYYVGDATQDNMGTFMLMEGAEEPYVVYIPGFRGFVSARYSANEDDWRDYTIFNAKIGDIASIKMEFPGDPGQSYLLKTGKDNTVDLISLASQEKESRFDTVRVLNFMTSFADIRFESPLNNLLKKSFIDSVEATVPSTIITLTREGGEVNTVKLFPKPSFASLYDQEGAALEPYDLDRAYAVVNHGEDFVLVQYFVFDKITRKLDYLLGKEE